MDDATLDRVQRVFGESRGLLSVYRQQIEHWRGSRPLSPAQSTEIERLGALVLEGQALVTEILRLADQIRPHTVDRILSTSDAELGLTYGLPAGRDRS